MPVVDRPNLTLGYSPCPNDTLVFYALVHEKINTGSLRFNEVLLDVETLNQKALNSELDVTKVSLHAYGYLRDRYVLLRSGGAIGRGAGPLLIARSEITPDKLRGKRIAIPGRLTTAYLLLKLYDPLLAENALVMPYNRIMDSVRGGGADAGLIIHELRFTYQNYGLYEVMDLGRWWEAETGLPIPLGCIIAKRGLGMDLIRDIDMLIRRSVEYGLSHRDEAKGYIKAHSQEMEDHVIERHINLYVNNYTIDADSEGIGAIEELLRRADGAGLTG